MSSRFHSLVTVRSVQIHDRPSLLRRNFANGTRAPQDRKGDYPHRNNSTPAAAALDYVHRLPYNHVPTQQQPVHDHGLDELRAMIPDDDMFRLVVKTEQKMRPEQQSAVAVERGKIVGPVAKPEKSEVKDSFTDAAKSRTRRWVSLHNANTLKELCARFIPDELERELHVNKIETLRQKSLSSSGHFEFLTEALRMEEDSLSGKIDSKLLRMFYNEERSLRPCYDAAMEEMVSQSTIKAVVKSFYRSVAQREGPKS